MIGQATRVSLPIVLINGEPAAAEAATISARDRGFTLADGLFETMRVRGGVIFRLDRHLSRLADGLRAMSIPQPAQLRPWIEHALTQAGPIDASVRLTVTRGPGPGGVAPPPEVRPTVVVAVNPLPAVPRATYEEGLRAAIASGRRNPHSPTSGLKTLAYTDAVVAWLEAQRAGADEAIFLDTDGHCSEATASNLFIVHDGSLLTPPVSCAALPGVTRATVLELAASLGIRAAERVIEPAQLAAADEAFLTSSLRGIAPVSSVDRRAVGTGAPGPATQRVMAAYQALVDQECGAA